MNLIGKLPRTTAAALLLLTAAACAGSGRKYHDAQMDFGAVRTVAIMPFGNLSRESVAGDRVRDVLANTLLATNAVYVVPAGETMRALLRANVPSPQTPSIDETVKLGGLLKADAIITGTVKEYGEVRSGAAGSNAISVSVQMYETQTGKLIWSASSTKGGLTFATRLFGGGGAPMNDVTEEAVDDLVGKLFK